MARDKTMKILYIGEKRTHDQYIKGNVPSHWLYGAVEMEQDGHEVIWAQEKSSFFNDVRLIFHSKPDIIFIPNLNLHNHILLLFLASIGMIKQPIYVWLHHEPSAKNCYEERIYRPLFKGIKHVFFLSSLTLHKTVEQGFINKNHCSTPGWGPDKDFYDRIVKTDNGWFVATGKENRDYDIIIEAFKETGAKLHIFTCRSHYGSDYTSLENKCKGISNIRLTLVDNSPENYKAMVAEMSSAHALVCPLRQDKLNYCVGLSTIADAEGLNKPLIITENPYHIERKDFLWSVKTKADWIKAIHKMDMKDNKFCESSFSMQSAYQYIKMVIGL